MKLGIILALFVSSLAKAQNICSTVSTQDKYQNAVATVAKAYDMTKEELCQSDRFLAVEAQPNRVIAYDGEVIPHVSVQLHSYSSSCLYMVRDRDQVITSSRCYSGE